MDAYGGFTHIVHHLEIMTNNIGQTFGREKYFHIHTTLEPFSSHTLFLNNYVRYIN
jgi:hypothetical protein